MRDIPRILLLLLVAIMLMGIISNYGGNQYNQDSTIKTLQETLKASAISSRDDSVRINKGIFMIEKESFEETFKSLYEKDRKTKFVPEIYTFDYLDNSLGGVKGIKVKIISDGREYQATTILDVAE